MLGGLGITASTEPRPMERRDGWAGQVGGEDECFDR